MAHDIAHFIGRVFCLEAPLKCPVRKKVPQHAPKAQQRVVPHRMRGALGLLWRLGRLRAAHKRASLVRPDFIKALRLAIDAAIRAQFKQKATTKIRYYADWRIVFVPEYRKPGRYGKYDPRKRKKKGPQ